MSSDRPYRYRRALLQAFLTLADPQAQAAQEQRDVDLPMQYPLQKFPRGGSSRARARPFNVIGSPRRDLSYRARCL